MKKIKIIGAGQLGSRHLQALKALSEVCEIEVVDPSSESLKVAEQRYHEVSPSHAHHKVSFNQEIKQKGDTDLAIIATTARARRQAINLLLESCKVNYLVLEKILFHKKEDYTVISDKLGQLASRTWVNCCMRMMPFYSRIQENFYDTPINYYVTGSQYGLVTNAIHYLDHVAYLTGCKTFTLDLRYLDNQAIPSKRSGYYELNGSMIAHFTNGSIANIQCLPKGSMPIQIEMFNDKHRMISREWQHKAWVCSDRNNWHWQEIEAKIPYQSELTTLLATELLSTGKCNLPKYQDSASIHIQMLEPLKEFLEKQQVSMDCDYPFT